MEFTAHTTVDVLREMSTLNRKWYSRPLSFLGSLRAILYLVVFLVVGVSLVYQGLQASPIDMHLVGRGLLVLLILFTVLGFLYYNNVRKTANRLAQHPPIHYTLTAEGIALTDPGESVVFTPWKAFSSFRFGKYIATLNRADQRGFQTIPIAALSPVEHGQLRGVLLSYLPERT